MRHPIRAKERDAVLELCQDIWEDHDSTLYQMAMKRSADFARTMGPFSEASAETIQGVRDDFDVFRATFQQACKFLVMDPKKTEP